jgi:pSer/pThr/pTyr-binding forkhead associated (FHA) protein
MARTTPRATPSLRLPRDSVPPEGTAEAAPLLAPAVIVSRSGEHELSNGSFGIGRMPSANLVLDDALVSRMHARILVLADRSVAVEDLHSTNGVFVNGARLGRVAKQLLDGDRLLIGTSELSVFNIRRGVAIARMVAKSVPVDAPPPSLAEPPSTGRGDALEMIGRFAERLASAGDYTEAASVISGHLNKVLLGASAGLAVPERTLEEASRYALLLFEWTHKCAWIDYVVELHLTVQRMPAETTLAEFEASINRPGASYDRDLLAYFHDSLEPRRRRMTLSEQARLLRLRRLFT